MLLREIFPLQRTLKLTLYIYISVVDAPPGIIQIYNTNSFDENTLTWNNKPDTGSLISNLSISTAGWYSIALNNHNSSIVVKLLSPLDTGGITFDSDDGVNKPYIIIPDCTFLDFSNIAYWDVGGYLSVVLNWLYDAPSCYLSPFWTFIDNIISIIYTSVSWVLNISYNISVFTVSIFALFMDIIFFITGLLYDIFSVNVYSAITFGLITTGLSLVLFMRIYNIISGTSMLGFKLPKI